MALRMCKTQSWLGLKRALHVASAHFGSAAPKSLLISNTWRITVAICSGTQYKDVSSIEILKEKSLLSQIKLLLHVLEASVRCDRTAPLSFGVGLERTKHGPAPRTAPLVT